MNAVTATVAAEPVSSVEIFVPLAKLKKSPRNARKAISIPRPQATSTARPAHPAGNSQPPEARCGACRCHHSIPEDGDFARWFAPTEAFCGGSGADIDRAFASAATIAQRLPFLSSDVDQAILCEAGFSDVALFYAGLSLRGCVAIA
ncbi:hypothetical protein WSK_2525 [Novosphingobium sp. Rr 2-17]|uniref:hypothetical protein n=1 Tax=Novosphingobium sp. Rr 2-17 TaxID=555793 RepID=UPI0002697B7F|nr:hypothetical protein [Novosphingobium sp. Rr 2-17]EIZ78981.1 hypothetical protein WSK_2525 [Novosphingobium sp. Rr 2-17]